jgi:hypothetical protein
MKARGSFSNRTATQEIDDAFEEKVTEIRHTLSAALARYPLAEAFKWFEENPMVREEVSQLQGLVEASYTAYKVRNRGNMGQSWV